MKIVGTELGRFAMFFPAEELRPLQGIPPQVSTRAIKEKYSFEYSPDFSKPWDEVQRDGFKFKLGRFSRDGKDALISDLGIYNDGIVINAHTTEDAEAFCSDLLDWGKKTFGFRDFIKAPRKAYASQITVEFDTSVSTIVNNFSNIAELFSNLLRKTYDVNFVIELHSLAFDYDHLIAPRIYDFVRFAIERRVNTKYEEGLFWCQAPLPTTAHIKALEDFERFLSAGKPTKK